jgi:GT2 family glycosyltransferase
MKVTIALVPYNNSRLFERLMGQIVSKTDFDLIDKETIIIDNSETLHDRAKVDELVEKNKNILNIRFVRNEKNTMLAPATNLAIDMADSNYFIYLCSSHTYIYDNRWLKNMVYWMDQHRDVVMGGTRVRWPNGIQDQKLHMHIQGGIFISPTAVLKKYKYNTEKFVHSYMDVDICETFLKEGLKIDTIPHMMSVLAGIPQKQHEDNKLNINHYIAHAGEIATYE